MGRINDGGPAFPGLEFPEGNGCAKRSFPEGDWEQYQPGMTLRDYFAGCALRGLTSNGDAIAASKDLAGLAEDEMERIVHGAAPKQAMVIANWCYGYADAMLAARTAHFDRAETQAAELVADPL